jgi:large subunit ribosomal protein L4
MKSPVFIGGGRVFGPKPRNYSFKLNKKLKVLARLSALSSLAKDNKVALIDSLSFDKPKTSEFVNVLGKLNFSNKKTLIVTANKDANLYLSSRNLQKVKVAEAADLNTYDLLKADTLLLTEESLNTLEQLYSAK